MKEFDKKLFKKLVSLIGLEKKNYYLRKNTIYYIAIETLGAIGPKSLALLKDLGRRIRSELGEPKSTEYLLQRLSVAVQRGNSISVLASTGI